jgi:hypothetical protein
MKKPLFTLAASCAVIGLLTACSSEGGDTGGSVASGEFVTAHNTQQLMAYIVEPQAQVFWGSAGFVIDEEGEHDLTPTTEEGWLATRSAAATVTEMGNLLMTPMFAEGRSEDWLTYSKALVEIGMKAEQAAADKDSDAVFETGGTMYNVCRACHQAYVGDVDPPPLPGDGLDAVGETAAQ